MSLMEREIAQQIQFPCSPMNILTFKKEFFSHKKNFEKHLKYLSMTQRRGQQQRLSRNSIYQQEARYKSFMEIQRDCVYLPNNSHFSKSLKSFPAQCNFSNR